MALDCTKFQMDISKLAGKILENFQVVADLSLLSVFGHQGAINCPTMTKINRGSKDSLLSICTKFGGFLQIFTFFLHVLRYPFETWHMHLICGTMTHLDRGNYCGLKLTDQVMKLLEWVLDYDIHDMMNINEMQFGFVPGRGTTDAIFIVCQLQKKYQSPQTNICTWPSLTYESLWSCASGCWVPVSARFQEPSSWSWAHPLCPHGQMTMTLHIYRPRQFQWTWFGVNQPSVCWVLVSARFQEPLLLCPWACPLCPHGQITMTLHIYRPRQLRWVGVNRSSGYWVMASAKFGPENRRMERRMDGQRKREHSIVPFFPPERMGTTKGNSLRKAILCSKWILHHYQSLGHCVIKEPLYIPAAVSGSWLSRQPLVTFLSPVGAGLH